MFYRIYIQHVKLYGFLSLYNKIKYAHLYNFKKLKIIKLNLLNIN